MMRWRVLDKREIDNRDRDGKEYFEFICSWRTPDYPTACVLEYFDTRTGEWVEVPFYDP